MAIPFVYNFRSVMLRWKTALTAVLSIAGVVAVFVAMLAMASGFKQTLVASGSPDNAIILRGGANSEMESAIALDQIRIIEDVDGVKRDAAGKSLISPEVVVIAAFPLISSGTDANVQVRGVSESVLNIRDAVRLSEGRFFISGLPELVVGQNALKNYQGFQLGNTIRFGGQDWTVVGIMDAGGTAFDSEIWCDAIVLNQTFKRPDHIFQSVTVKLSNPDRFSDFKDALTSDPRLTVSVEREIRYYEKQSEMVFKLINVLGFLVAFVMGIGAIFGAINTMYSTVSARSREIATLRAVGFPEKSIVISFIMESLFISLIGGILGILVILPINGSIASTVNWQTFSHLSFAFLITPRIAMEGLLFALIMGLIGGIYPSFRAARIPVAVALRGL